MMEVHGEGTTKAIVEEDKQADQNVLVVQMMSVSPQENIVQVKDVSDTIIQNINPLIEEDMKNILIYSTTKEQLCSHPILVSVDKIEKEKLASARENHKNYPLLPLNLQK